MEEEIKKLIKKYKPAKRSTVSFSLIKIGDGYKKRFSYNEDLFLYPASIYKIFIAAEVLRQVENGLLGLDQKILIKEKNIVGDNGIFPKKENSIYLNKKQFSINELLNLMLSISDNTASNSLIDLVSRENITKNIINKNGWHGSEITRKFLTREKEDEIYMLSKPTMSCVRHISDFLLLVEEDKLISPFVSNKIKEYMLHCSNTELSLEIDEFKNYYHKTGSLEVNLWKISLIKALKNIIKKGWAISTWQHDAGVFEYKNSKFVIVLLTYSKTIKRKIFLMKDFSKELVKLF